MEEASCYVPAAGVMLRPRRRLLPGIFCRRRPSVIERAFAYIGGVATTQTTSKGGLRAAIVADWRAIGGLGRFALLGVVGSLVVAVGLGFAITTAARDHLLESRAHLIESVVEELYPLYPAPHTGQPVTDAFDEGVRLRLLGGETVRVKLWLEDGTIAYSDSPDLAAQVFELAAPAQSALEGTASHRISDLSDPAHRGERDLGRLIEFYVPYGPEDGEPVAAFEVEQLPASLDEAMASIRRNVWLSIGSGIGLLALFLGTLIVARSRDLDRRRRQAEQLVGALTTAQDEERRRIVGALHDDVGQPLYRLLYGIEGSRNKLQADHPAAQELHRLAGVVRDIDSTLRREMRLLHDDLLADAGLVPALESLASVTENETDLVVELSVQLETEPDAVPRAALYRAISEGLTNVRKHAGASRVGIAVSGSASVVTAEITDDGQGARIEPGLGLTTTRDRLEALGGGLEVGSRRGNGTRYRVWVPISGLARP